MEGGNCSWQATDEWCATLVSCRQCMALLWLELLPGTTAVRKVGGRKQNTEAAVCSRSGTYICVVLVVKDFRFQGSSVGTEYNIGYFCPGTGTASPSCRSCYPATPGPARLYSSSTNLRRIEIVTLYHTYLIGTRQSGPLAPYMHTAVTQSRLCTAFTPLLSVPT